MIFWKFFLAGKRYNGPRRKFIPEKTPMSIGSLNYEFKADSCKIITRLAKLSSYLEPGGFLFTFYKRHRNQTTKIARTHSICKYSKKLLFTKCI